MKKKLVLGMAGVMAFTTLLGTNVVIGNADEDKVQYHLYLQRKC